MNRREALLRLGTGGTALAGVASGCLSRRGAGTETSVSEQEETVFVGTYHADLGPNAETDCRR